MKILKYVLRELLNNRQFVFLFVLNLSLGLTGFIALDGFKNSIDQTIRGRSKAVLGADFGLSARRPLKQLEIDLVGNFIGEEVQTSSMIEMFSMVANKNRRSRLTQVKAIEENYPFYGEIQLRQRGSVNEKRHRELLEKPRIWIYPELTRQLKVEIGDSLFIGDLEFEVFDIIDSDAAAGISTSMAPRVYMNKKFLKKTGLVKGGTIAWYSQLYRLPGRSSEELDLYRDQVFKNIDNPEVQVYTHENVSAQMTTLISRLNDFLGLASLVALFLAGVGSAFLFRAYFRERIKSVAVLMSIGASRTQAFLFYLGQIFILGFLSSTLAIGFSFLIVPGLGNLTAELLPFDVQFFLVPSTVALGFLMGTLGSLSLCLPVLFSLRGLSPAKLLVSEKEESQVRFSWGPLFAALPGLVLFWVLSVWLSHSYLVGSLFTGLFLTSGFFMGLISLVLFKFLNRALKPKNLGLTWALRDLSRNYLTTLICFISIGLGSLLLNLIPQLEASLSAELEQPEQSKVPSLFMFDIQEEQVSQFREILKSQEVPVDQISPMIRARLVKVNDEGFDKGVGSFSKKFSREEEREMRFRNRGFNLSYKEKLSQSETIVSGKEFSGTYNEEGKELPEISVEKRFADRLKLKLGDKLTFDIESIPVEGRITNLRKVQWTSFQPNFFVQFQPGVLEIAPKTFIATVPSLDLDKKHQVQDLLVEKLPNVSMVDVSRIVKRISGIIEQMSWALAFMSFLCLFAGFVVIYSIANHQANTRRWDIGLLKSLGASFAVIRGQFLWQFAIIGLAATSAGALLSLVISYVLSSFLFESLWAFNWVTPTLSVVGGLVVSLFVTEWATRSALKMKVRDLFS